MISKRPTRIPGFIGTLQKGNEAALIKQVNDLTEAVDIRLGRRGDPLDRAPTLRELVAMNLVSAVDGLKFDPNNITPSNVGATPNTPGTDTTIPPAPTGFSTGSGYAVITLFWGFPNYSNHSYTEIWRGTTDVLGDAQLLGTSGGRSFTDYAGSDATFYYWIRHVSTSNFTGPWNGAAGTLGNTTSNTAALLADLAGAITTSELATSLNTRLDSYGLSISANTSGIIDLYAEYTVKLNVNGRVTGFGLASTDTSSAFFIMADRFAVVSTVDNSITGTPFVVQAVDTVVDGVPVPAGVYLSTAFIKNASIVNAMIANAAIDNAKIANLDAGKINTGLLSTSRINLDGITLINDAGKLRVGSIKVDNLEAASITTDKLVGAAINAVLTSDITVVNSLPTNATYETVDTVRYNKTQPESLIILEFQAEMVCTGSGNYALSVQFTRDGTVCSRTFTYFLTKSFAQLVQGKMILVGYPPGSANYGLRIRADVSGAGVATATVNNSTVIITEVKR